MVFKGAFIQQEYLYAESMKKYELYIVAKNIVVKIHF